MYGDLNQPHARLTKTRRELMGAFADSEAWRSRPCFMPSRSWGGAGFAGHSLRAESEVSHFPFMSGGPSHLETFDPKPLLNKLHGQKRPEEFGKAEYQFVENDALILGTKRTFKKYGQSGIEVSDLFPHMATCLHRP